MPIAAVPASTETSVLEELKRRGLLATGGNIRTIPFASGPTDVNGSGSSGASGAGTPARPAGATPIVDANDNLVNAETGEPLSKEEASAWWPWLLAGGVAGGAAAALMRRKGGVATGAVDENGIPIVEGEALDPLAARPTAADVVNGEYTEVNPPAQLAQQDGVVSARPPSAAQVVTERKLTARQRPQANPTAQSDTSVVRAGDALTDLTEDEVIQASKITQELVDARKRGNKARSNQSKFSSRAVLPTGSEDEEGMFNTVVRMIREGKIKPSQLIRAVP